MAGPGSRVEEWSQDLSQLRRYGGRRSPARFYPLGRQPQHAGGAGDGVRPLWLGALGTGAGSAELAVLLNRLALDPTSLITGIDSALLPKLMSQADGDGIWRLGPARWATWTWPWRCRCSTSPATIDGLSARLAATTTARTSTPTSSRMWGQIFKPASQRFFGTGTGDNIAWRSVNAVGDAAFGAG